MENKRTYFFVDESGDLSRFDKKGRSLLGVEGVSKTFMLGSLEVLEPIEEIIKKMEELRADLIKDPCLLRTPSLKKTKLCFHAKDDCAAVRREMFKILKNMKARVRVMVRRKSELIRLSKHSFELNKVKVSEATIYSSMVSRLFKPLLHKNSYNHILFSQRGKTFNTESLQKAIEIAKDNCYHDWGIKNDNIITIEHSSPSNHIGLQIVDYYLWALSRLYEQDDDSYFNYLRDKYSLIWDLDDKTKKDCGVYYTQKNPISLEKIKEL